MPRVYSRKDPDDVASEWLSLRITPAMNRKLKEMSVGAKRTKGNVAREILEKAMAEI